MRAALSKFLRGLVMGALAMTASSIVQAAETIPGSSQGSGDAPRRIAIVASVTSSWDRTIEDRPNQSFLADTHTVDPPFALRDELMSPKLAAQMQQRWDDLNRNYEMRERHDLVGRAEQQSHLDRVKGFTRAVIGEVKNLFVKKQVEKVKEATERDSTLLALSKAGAIAAFVAAIYSGRPYEVTLGEGAKASAKAEVPKHRGNVKVEAPWLSASVDFITSSAARTQEDLERAGKPAPREEAYRVSVNRKLPLWDLGSGVSYGATSRTLTASLSKQLYPHLVGILDSTRVIAHNRWSPRSEETLRFLYRMDF